MRSPLSIDSSFSQFIFDNADFNTQTIDGHNTFHAMGGIHCISPANAVTSDQPIARVLKKPSADLLGKFGTIKLQSFEKRDPEKSAKIKIEDLDYRKVFEGKIMPSSFDLLWLFGKTRNPDEVPGWGGFMERSTAELPIETSFISYLPSIHHLQIMILFTLR